MSSLGRGNNDVKTATLITQLRDLAEGNISQQCAERLAKAIVRGLARYNGKMN